MEQRLSWLGPLCRVPGPQRGQGVRSPATDGTNSHRLLKEHETFLEPHARSPLPLGGHVAPFLQKEGSHPGPQNTSAGSAVKTSGSGEQAAAFFLFSLRDPTEGERSSQGRTPPHGMVW